MVERVYRDLETSKSSTNRNRHALETKKPTLNNKDMIINGHSQKKRKLPPGSNNVVNICMKHAWVQ